MTDPSKPYTAQMDTVDGWFYAVDVDFFSKLLAYQRTEGVKGDMLEIGTYQGKSAILMGYGLRDDEELVVCDLFGAVMDHADIPLSRRQEYRAWMRTSSWPTGIGFTPDGQRWKSANHRNSTWETGHFGSSTSTVATAISASSRTSVWLWLTRANGA